MKNGPLTLNALAERLREFADSLDGAAKQERPDSIREDMRTLIGIIVGANMNGHALSRAIEIERKHFGDYHKSN